MLTPRCRNHLGRMGATALALIVMSCSGGNAANEPGVGSGGTGTPGTGGTAGTGGSGGSAGDAGPDVTTCKVGEFRCDGDQLMACEDDASGFHPVAPCGPGLCDAIEGQCDLCIANEASCTGATVREYCTSDGQQLLTESCDTPAPHCREGSCVECATTADCPLSTSECRLAACSSEGACGFVPVAAASPCGPAADPGQCDGAGQCAFCDPGEVRCDSNIPQACNADAHWEGATACASPTPICNDGTCVQCLDASGCAPPTNPCQQAACSSSGTCGFTPKPNGTTCPGGTCNGAGICSTCTPGTATCNGTTPLVCDANGQYQSGAPCSGSTPLCNQYNGQCVQCVTVLDCPPTSNACLSTSCLTNTCSISTVPAGTSCPGGTCNGNGQCWACTPGQTQCKPGSTNVVQLCSASGTWVDNQTCPIVCEVQSGTAQCGGSCVPGTLRCDPGNPSVPQSCSAGGSWVSGLACPYLCSAGTCTGVCSPGSRQCKAGVTNVPQLCDSAALWQDQTPCSGAMPVCSAGTCIAADCTAISWNAGQVPSASTVLTYPTAWTMEGWALVPAFAPQWGALIGVDAVETGCGMPAGKHWYVSIDAAGKVVAFLGTGLVPSTATISTNTWFHFALQAHGDGTGSFYLNGQLKQSFTGVPSVWPTSCPLRLGNTQGSETHFLGARVASLRYSSTRRYTSAFVPSAKLTVDASALSVFDMDEGTGGTAYDDVANKPLALNGATWIAVGPECSPNP